jgi:hypothetical protein
MPVRSVLASSQSGTGTLKYWRVLAVPEQKVILVAVGVENTAQPNGSTTRHPGDAAALQGGRRGVHLVS